MLNFSKAFRRACAGVSLLLSFLPAVTFAQSLEPLAIGVFNGFNAHLNVVECINLGGEDGYVSVEVIANDGERLGNERLFVPATGSPHLVLNSFGITDRTGTFIIRPEVDEDEQTPNLRLSCLTSIYRPAGPGATRAVEYAFVLPARPPLRGATAGTFNSMNPQGGERPVYNWLSVYNPGELPLEGAVQLYDQQGNFLEAFSIDSMPAGAREDFPLGHERGQTVGMYRIVLFDDEQPYGAFLTRYSQADDGSFTFAFPLQARSGSCEPTLLPISTMDPATNWGELANPGLREVRARITIRGADGRELHSESRTLKSFAQEHLYINAHLGERAVGTLEVTCEDAEDSEQALLAQSLFYGHPSSGTTEVQWAYATQAPLAAVQPGDALAVPVNTHYEAANWFKVLNASAEAALVQHSAYALDGRKVDLIAEEPSQRNLFTIAPQGTSDVAVHQLAGSSFVGTAAVSSPTLESVLVAEMLRVFPATGGGIGYIMPVPAVRVRHALNADSRELTVNIDADTEIELTASNEEQYDIERFHSYVSRGPEHGRVFGSWPNFTYRPDAHYRGEDSFEFRVYDGTTWSNPGRVYVNVSAWDDYTGIPEPAFGFRERASERPRLWREETPGFYYVDRYHPAATDAGNSFGTPERPRQTIPDSLPPGAVVELHGVYDHAPNGLFFSLTSSGTAAAPIFIRGFDTETRPEITQPWHISGQYLVLENLIFTSAQEDRSAGGPAGELLIFGSAANVAVRYSDISGNVERGGVDIFGFGGQSVSNVLLYDNYIHDNGVRWGSNESHPELHGVRIREGAHHVWVLDTRLQNNGGDGVRVAAGSLQGLEQTHHIYLAGNDAISNRYSGYWVQHAADVIIAHNRARYHRPSNTPVEDVRTLGACAGYEFGPRSVWFINNRFDNCELGIASASEADPNGLVGPGEDIVVFGNVLRDIRNNGESANGVWKDGAAVRLADNGPLKFVVNNTIFRVDAGVLAPAAQGGVVLANNIFAAVDAEHVYVDRADAAAASWIHNTLFSSLAKLKWGGGTTLRIPTLQAQHPGQCVACVEAAPAFESEDSLRLSTASPARDAGYDPLLQLLQTRFFELYGIPLVHDAAREERSIGVAVDLGAYELQPSS
ncbi:MAG: right-handed parallel beta-helix repeat-containing protein [Bdellovibrionales bacterium]|nr:right-handed parallel beta-helix repeat-containing protein [Bdellovibrionales bacterium]